MRLEDYFDAVQFRSRGRPPAADEWVDELRLQAGIDSFRDFG